MKKIFRWTTLFIISAALAGCRSDHSESGLEVTLAEETSQAAGGDDGTESLELEMKNPIVFASYTFDGDGSYYTLLFECIGGTYDSNSSMWNRQWSGTFRFRRTEAEPGVNLEPYQEGVISCQLQQAFAGPFQMYVKDYNGDGLMEFAVTQTESSGGGDTGRMFALQKDGRVVEIPIKNDRRYVDAFGSIGLQDEDSGIYFMGEAEGILRYKNTEV